MIYCPLAFCVMVRNLENWSSSGHRPGELRMSFESVSQSNEPGKLR
jgi:hypothetical protein